jgi:hypothetical protein
MGPFMDKCFQITLKKGVLYVGLFAADIILKRDHIIAPQLRKAPKRLEIGSTAGRRFHVPRTLDAGHPIA